MSARALSLSQAEARLTDLRHQLGSLQLQLARCRRMWSSMRALDAGETALAEVSMQITALEREIREVPRSVGSAFATF